MGGTVISPVQERTLTPHKFVETNFSRPQTARSKKAPSILEPLSQSTDSLSHRRDSGLATSITPEIPTRRGRIPVFDSSSAPPVPALQTASVPPKTAGGAAPSIADGKSIRSQMAASILSPEDEVLSLKVRSLYDSGVGTGGSDAGSQFSKRVSSVMEEGKRMSRVSRNSFIVGRNSSSGDEGGIAEGEEGIESVFQGGDTSEAAGNRNSAAVVEERSEFLRAGGAEDWEDVDGRDVDRYGFINPTYLPSTPTDPTTNTTPQPAPTTRPFAPPKRISTALHLHSKIPQKRTHHLHLRLSPFSNPAPEMLRSPLPGASAALREKENSRAKKWRDMAVVRKRSERGDEGGKGGGCEWGFVTRDPKLVSRTWKGIPDCWRAAAWHAFLTASAKSRGIGKGDGELVEIYAEFTLRPSADDVQIDLDVPRTINSHIMFRQRYRGGQRLLFRVLHALSLYFTSVGYVQGMASLAATLLCYYDEETAFVMLVRMFELRGLEKLYQAGFEGLMVALEEFEGGWIKGGTVCKKLSNLGIGPTAYGTRWYLTLFNYSMPFPAQLRVWDVFMLLGDPDPTPTSASSRFFAAKSSASVNEVGVEGEVGFGGTLDILHATSAALIDSMKEIIIKSDFEGVMKVLTSWIPVKDEELLMKVAKAEWKMRKRRRSRGGSVGGAPGRASLG